MRFQTYPSQSIERRRSDERDFYPKSGECDLRRGTYNCKGSDREEQKEAGQNEKRRESSKLGKKSESVENCRNDRPWLPKLMGDTLLRRLIKSSTIVPLVKISSCAGSQKGVPSSSKG